MDNKEKSFVSGVIYVHNDENVIEDFLKFIIFFFEENFERSEIICVNDNSCDLSLNKIRDISKLAQKTSISVINMNYYHGVEAAMYAGVDLSIGDFVFEFDSVYKDFKESDIINIYHRSLQGYDIVSASPDIKQKFSSKIFYHLFNRYSDLDYSMNSERFRILSRRVINRISSMSSSVPYRKAAYANCGLKTDCIKYNILTGIEFSKNDKIEKKYRTSLAVDSMMIFTNLGYRISTAMTSLMMLVALFFIFYSLGIYITGSPVEGWTTIILFLSICFIGVFGISSMIIKYLQIIVNLSFKKKKYNFESIEKLTK